MQKRFLLTILLVVLGEVYTFFLVRSALRNMAAPWRVGLFSLYIFATLVTWASMFFFRKIDWANLPHMTRNIFVAFTIGFFVAKILVASVMLIDDLRRLFVVLSARFFPTVVANTYSVQTGIPRSQFLRSLALMLGGISVSGFLYGITNRYRYQVKKQQISFDNLPKSFKGLRIAQISDVHAGSFDNKEAVLRGVEKIMEQRPDIIFFTGDLVNNKAEEMKPYADIFANLNAPLGVYSVLGNHDYGDYVPWESAEAKAANLQALKDTHKRMGWRLLMNEHVVLERGGEKIAVLGIENWGAKANFPKYGDMKRAYAGLTEKQVPFKILLSHDPSHFDAQVQTMYKDIDLTLSGHTHGMQFGIEIPGIKWSPVRYVYSKWAGLYQVGRQYLYVNRGYGFLGYPGRIGILPEITVIDLV